MNDGQHKVTVRAGRRVIENWISYDIQQDMLTAADGFSLQLGPADPEGEEFAGVFAAVAPDTQVDVLLDDVTILSGYIDDRVGASTMDADVITISGRDRAGRLVDESMPLLSFSGLDLEQLALKIASPWFDRVDFSNATNRGLLRGKARGAKGGRAYKEPGVPRAARAYRKVEPGEKRWDVLEYFLHELELLAWSAGNGHSLVIGQPNYDQEPTYDFFHPRAGSARAAKGNVLSFTLTESVGERYSQVVAVGANVGNAVNYGEKTVKRRGVASNGPGLYGVGKDFQQRKVLLVADDSVKDDAQAKVHATREMAERDAQGYEIRVQVEGHAQELEGARAPTLYACDHMAMVESEVFGVKGLFLITSVRFTRDRQQGELTEIRMVPRGTLLRA